LLVSIKKNEETVGRVSASIGLNQHLNCGKGLQTKQLFFIVFVFEFAEKNLLHQLDSWN